MNDAIIKRNTSHVDFNDESLDNVRFVNIICMPAVGKHLIAKYYVNNAISNSVDESTFLRLDPCEKLILDEQYSLSLISTLTLPELILEMYRIKCW